MKRTCTTCVHVALRGCDVPAKAPEARAVRAWLTTESWGRGGAIEDPRTPCPGWRARPIAPPAPPLLIGNP